MSDAELIAAFEQHLRQLGYDADAIQSYLDFGASATAGTQRLWLKLLRDDFHYPLDQGEALRAALQRWHQLREQQWIDEEHQRRRRLALHRQTLAHYGSEVQASQPAPALAVAHGLERQARIIEALARRHPEIRQLIADGQVTALVHGDPYRYGVPDRALASYDPKRRVIEIYDAGNCTTTVLVHELGHAAEHYLQRAGIDLWRDPAWDRDQPAASQYGATDRRDEKWAEAWTASLGEQEQTFRRHAPQQAEAVAKVRAHILRPGPRGCQPRPMSHLSPSDTSDPSGPSEPRPRGVPGRVAPPTFRRHAPQQAEAVAKVRAHLRGPVARGRRRGR